MTLLGLRCQTEWFDAKPVAVSQLFRGEEFTVTAASSVAGLAR